MPFGKRKEHYTIHLDVYIYCQCNYRISLNLWYYLFFYFVIFSHQLQLKNFWISLIHPLIFVVSVYTWIHPFFGDTLLRVMTDLESASYVYPFLDPSIYVRGTLGLILFNFGLLTTLIFIISILMILLKRKFETSISKIIL